MDAMFAPLPSAVPAAEDEPVQKECLDLEQQENGLLREELEGERKEHDETRGTRCGLFFGSVCFSRGAHDVRHVCEQVLIRLKL